QQAQFAVLDPASQALEVMACSPQGVSGPPLVSRSAHETLARRVIRQQAPLLIADGARDPQAHALGVTVLGSWLSMPLRAGQETVGAMTLSSPSVHAFGPHHLRLLEVVAELSALALIQAQQRDAVVQRNQQLKVLFEVARRLGTPLDTGALVDLAV